MSKIRNTGISSLYLAQLVSAQHKNFKHFCSSSLWTSLNHMVILRSQNKITDFFMILAWVWDFNYDLNINYKCHITITITITITKIYIAPKKMIHKRMFIAVEKHY